MAQKKHSFAIGIDNVNYMYHREWYRPDVQRQNGAKESWTANWAPWLAYYYRNTWSIRMYRSVLTQQAKYTGPIYLFPDNLPLYTETSFNDLTIGYNFLHNSRLHKVLSVWGYAGAGIGIGRGSLARGSFILGSPHEIEFTGGRYYKNIIYPTGQVLVKYNPLPFVFIGAGATYHYLFRDFQPVSGNLTVGFQL